VILLGIGTGIDTGNVVGDINLVEIVDLVDLVSIDMLGPNPKPDPKPD
jgi:hypothetical protein